MHRLEFEIGRQGLVEFDLNTPDQVLAAAGDLWAYATGEWLTYRSPTADQTRSRWPLAPEWLQVQQATLGHRAVGVERLRLARRSTSIEKLLPGLTGYLASLGALIGTEGIDDTLGAIGHHLHTYEIVSHTPSPSGWPAAAANWSCGERGRARLRAGGGGARADRVCAW